LGQGWTGATEAARCRKIREAQGLSLADVQRLTGIQAPAQRTGLSFAVDTLTRYAAGVGKHVLFQLADATEA
jgi:hypothetical protein